MPLIRLTFKVDVYQAKALRPRAHVGRYEARISQIPFLSPKNPQTEPKYPSNIVFSL